MQSRVPIMTSYFSLVDKFSRSRHLDAAVQVNIFKLTVRYSSVTGSCSALNWQLTMRLAGHESEFSHNEHNASVIQLVSNNTKFIEMSTPKPIFYQILLFWSQINMLFEQFNLELLSWVTRYKQVAKSYLVLLKILAWRNTLWAYCCL